jgi:hypothetical protein
MPLGIGFTRFKFTLKKEKSLISNLHHIILMLIGQNSLVFNLYLKRRMNYDSRNWFSIVRDPFWGRRSYALLISWHHSHKILKGDEQGNTNFAGPC